MLDFTLTNNALELSENFARIIKEFVLEEHILQNPISEFISISVRAKNILLGKHTTPNNEIFLYDHRAECSNIR